MLKYCVGVLVLLPGTAGTGGSQRERPPGAQVLKEQACWKGHLSHVGPKGTPRPTLPRDVYLGFVACLEMMIRTKHCPLPHKSEL